MMFFPIEADKLFTFIISSLKLIKRIQIKPLSPDNALYENIENENFESGHYNCAKFEVINRYYRRFKLILIVCTVHKPYEYIEYTAESITK